MFDDTEIGPPEFATIEQMYSPAYCAKMLDISIRTLERRIERHNIPHTRLGRYIRIRKSVLASIIEGGWENAKAGPVRTDAASELANGGER